MQLPGMIQRNAHALAIYFFCLGWLRAPCGMKRSGESAGALEQAIVYRQNTRMEEGQGNMWSKQPQ